MLDRQSDDASPRLLSLQHGVTEIVLQDEVGNCAVGLVGLVDPVEEAGPDDAAAAPNLRNLAQAQIPAVFLRGGRHLLKALRVGDDLRGIERVPDRVDVRLIGLPPVACLWGNFFSALARNARCADRRGRRRLR